MADISGFFTNNCCTDIKQICVTTNGNHKIFVGKRYFYEDSNENQLGQGYTAIVFMVIYNLTKSINNT